MRNTTPFALFAVAALASAGFAAGESAGAKSDEWKDHMGDIPFIVGHEAGVKEAEFTGKPIFFFYTAHG